MLNGEISIIYKCECNEKTYPSLQSLKSHKKTKLHKAWESINELRLLKIQLTEKDNEILNLSSKVKLLKDLNTTLLHRISVDT